VEVESVLHRKRIIVEQVEVEQATAGSKEHQDLLSAGGAGGTGFTAVFIISGTIPNLRRWWQEVVDGQITTRL
jgi:hypothetical protein